MDPRVHFWPAKVGPQKWTPGSTFGQQRWVPKNGPPGPLLASKGGPQKWTPRSIFGKQRWVPKADPRVHFWPAKVGPQKWAPKVDPQVHFWQAKVGPQSGPPGPFLASKGGYPKRTPQPTFDNERFRRLSFVAKSGLGVPFPQFTFRAYFRCTCGLPPLLRQGGNRSHSQTVHYERHSYMCTCSIDYYLH